MSSLPNIQTTLMLFMVLGENVRFKEGALGVTLYMILQVVLYGIGLWFIPMYLAWLKLIIIARMSKHKNIYVKAAIAGMYGLVYGMWFLPLTVIVYGVSPLAYIISDIPFAILMSVSSFITVLLLSQRVNAIIRSKFTP